MIPVIAIFAVLSLASASPYQYRIEPYQMAEDYQAQTESQESALKYQQQNFDGYHKQLTQPFQPQSAQAVQHQSGHAFQNPSVQQYQQLSAPEYQHESAQSFSYQPNQNYQYQPSESAAYKPQGFQNQPVQYSHQNYQQSQIQTAHSQTGGHEQNSQGNARILSYQQNSDEHNNYQYGYETENGIRAQETSDGTKTQGEYSYVGDDGQVYTVTYTADETGFHPSGAHLPTPPPIPDAIAKSIEKNLLDEANGIVDDGQYHELEQHTQQSEQMHQVVEPPVPYHQKMIVKKSANEQQRVQTPRPIQRDIHLKQHKHLEPHNVHLEKQDFHLKQQDLQDHQLQPQHVTQQPEKQLLVQKREPIIPFRQSHNLLLNIMNPEHNLMDHQGTDHHYYHNRFQQFAPMNELNSQTRLVQQIPQSKNVQLIHQLQNGFVPQHEYQVPLETSLIEKRPNIKEKYLMSHVLHHSRPIRLYHTPLFMKYSHPKEYLNPTAL